MNQSLVVKILVANTLFTTYIKYRQYKALGAKRSQTNVNLMTKEEYEKSVKYNKARCLFSVFTAFIELFKDIYIFKQIQWFYSTYLLKNSHGDALMMTAYVLFCAITSIPTNALNTFVLEAYFGFNKTTIGTFLRDIIIGNGLIGIFTFGITSVCIYLIKSGLPHFYVYIWAFLCSFTILFQMAYVRFIAPIFNKFTPLEDEELKKKIHNLADKIGFKTEKILVMDGSKRTSHSNAFFTGIGKVKNIVFFDTILSQLGHDEIIGVLSHELGHWAKWHTYLLTGVSFLTIFFFLYLFNFVLTAYKALPLAIVMIYYNYLANLVTMPLNLLQNTFVRCLERQADRFAVNLGFGKSLYDALIKISKENLSAPVNDPLYSCLVHSHPPLRERLQIIESEMDRITKKEE